MSEKTAFAGRGLWVLALVIVSAVVLGALNYVGLLGRTIVEREVFEQSYQYTAGQKAKIAAFEAQLAEIQSQLDRPGLDTQTHYDLEAAAAALRVQLNAARSLQP